MAPRTQAFGAVDVLFVLDTSCSMGPALDDLVARAQTFIQNLVLARLQNFHIGVTTMDVGPGAAAGRLVTPMITGGSADPAHDLSTALDVGNTGSSSAQGLEAARLALDPATNPGFLRADAGLLVIFVADDEDTSPGLAASYVSPIVGTHDPYNAAVNTIIGDVPGGCSAPLLGITAAAGTRYDFLRALLSGSFSSICAASPLAALSHFGPPQLGLARALQLSAPYPSQIIGIEVGGQRLSGFTYDAPSGVIHFAPDQVPAGGSVLSIQVPCP